MAKHPVQPFHDAANNIEPEQSKAQPFTNPYPARDKDNTAHAIKPPSWGIAGTSRQGPAGTIGYRGPMIDKSTEKPNIEITKGDLEKDLWIEGKILSMEGVSFQAKIYDLPSELGINNGKISKLSISENGNQIAYYDRGWDRLPESPKAKEAPAKILDHFDPPEKEFKPIAPPSQDKGQGRDR